MIHWMWRFTPIPISTVLFFVLWFAVTQAVAYAFLGGAIACWLGELCFCGLLFKPITQKKSRYFLGLFYVAELLKLVIYSIALVLIIIKFHLMPQVALVGFLMNIILFLVFSVKAIR